ncbi:CDP-diacylglycerol--glycerol-3-phosphate 3-phosphatidyltransferase [Thermostichus vulcanus]|uniref:CDP-diacylglycerol--glycerol-3-phosphate 3-phosphatidyltransferase n=1 Tax=Thermostichus vulcanus str. 'Rupite' TaxID=2813851 RepID=A0ABT0CA16_THEVL|nr:CDP-diacylglycerol--glycerol-3-phosphate 3-phosphatidyltransferase [Thermostichus vulcanus]MCJ2542562.1 CDP-diacylglycerol--glycerol-3-phosphate 3-phosphatidyltransferase [Thermostichus vulcanus str. 'Rupite']
MNSGEANVESGILGQRPKLAWVNLPTAITLLRLAGIPFILLGLSWGSPAGEGLAFWAFLLAAATDWLDGYLARRYGLVTEVGKFLDPLVDKLLVLAPLLSLLELGRIPAWGVFLIVGRELAIAGWRVNQTQIRGANLWGKAKTVTQILAIALLILGWPVGIPCFWLAVVLTLLSGLMYLRNDPAELEPDPRSRLDKESTSA